MYQPGGGAGTSSLSSNMLDQRPLLLCFSHLRWHFVHQRPQHLLSRAARTFDVVFVEESVWEDIPEARLELATEPGGVLRAVAFLPWGTGEKDAEAIQRRFIDELAARRQRAEFVLWYYTPMALAFSRHLEADIVVYDCMDELSAFRGAPPRMTELEGELFARADIVFTGGRSLYEAKRNQHHRVRAFPSSIDAAHFSKARAFTGAEPADQAHIPHPRLGFFGVVDERMDLELLSSLADLRPDWHFVMIGPVVKIDPADLPVRPNIHWLGGKSYDELPAYLAGWDLGLMPFALNESTRFISPTKTPEYLAAGVPVISTPIVDVVRSYGDRGLVEIAADAPGVIQRAEALLARPREPWLAEVDRALAGSSWDVTWAAMHDLMQSVRQSKQQPLPVHAMPAAAAHV